MENNAQGNPGPTGSGGGLHLTDGDRASITNLTISGNTSAVAPAGIDDESSRGPITLKGTILYANTTAGLETECKGATYSLTSAGYNLVGDTSCNLGGQGDQNGADPLLTPLASNGGPTQTEALLPGSPAIDADAACPPPATDQRGAPRPDQAGTPCDVGAFETGAQVPAVATNTLSLAANPTTLVAGSGATSTVTATVDNSGSPVSGDQVTFTTTGTCGALSSNTGTTNAAGQVVVTYTAATSAGTCTITATEATDKASAATPIAQTSSPGGGGTGSGGGGGTGSGTTTPGTTTTTTGTTTTTAPAGQPASARLAGPTRIGTAIATSQQAFPMAGTAQSVSLARDDIYPDALAGGPYSVAKGGPLLLSEPTQLDPATLAEVQRVLPKGGTVYLLGGTDALSDAVSTALTNAGFHPVRVSGPDRFATAVAIANALSPTTVFEASGINFPDALSAGPAAVVSRGAILLTHGAVQSSATSAYLGSHPGDTRYAVGGPAAAADPSATPLVGADRFATSAAVATKFFAAPTTVGIATGLDFPDSLTATPLLGPEGAPILLVNPTGPLSPSVSSYLSAHDTTIKTVQVFGGSAAVSDAVVAEVNAAA